MDGPLRSSSHFLICCGAALQTSHSLRLRNLGASELTVCGRSCPLATKTFLARIQAAIGGCNMTNFETDLAEIIGKPSTQRPSSARVTRLRFMYGSWGIMRLRQVATGGGFGTLIAGSTFILGARTTTQNERRAVRGHQLHYFALTGSRPLFPTYWKPIFSLNHQREWQTCPPAILKLLTCS
jgi:hypothetical protein